MTREGAERTVTISALIVAGIYIYRRMTEGSAPPAAGKKLSALAGQGTPPPVGVFITGWGFTYLVISIVASASPGLGGSFALLVAAGDLLSNLNQVAKDISGKVVGQPTPTTPAPVNPHLFNVPGGGTAPYRPPTHLNNPVP